MHLDLIRKFTRNSGSPVPVSFLFSSLVFSGELRWTQTDIAAVGKKVVEFYKKKGGEVVSPLVKAL